ncbi:MAG: ribbon-helix-helix domain-containing protein [Candidatus Hadarchaeaceae archaeon]
MTKRATIPVSMSVDVIKRVDNVRAKLGYRSRNEVIRESVRHFLEEIEEMKVIRIRNISLKQAKKEILAYLKQRNSAYVSDIADTLGIDIRLAFKAVEGLQREGEVE